MCVVRPRDCHRDSYGSLGSRLRECCFRASRLSRSVEKSLAKFWLGSGIFCNAAEPERHRYAVRRALVSVFLGGIDFAAIHIKGIFACSLRRELAIDNSVPEINGAN